MAGDATPGRGPADAGPGGLWAWAFYDWANNGFATVVQTFVFAAYFTRQLAESPSQGTALWGTATGAAGLVVAVGGPVLGAVADQGRRRKPWIAVFTALCVTGTALLWLARPDPALVPLALGLVALAAVGSELANLFYNAMLPDLAPPGRLGRWSGMGWSLGYVGGLACLGLAWLLFLRETPWVRVDAAGGSVRATCLLAAAWYALFALPLLLATPEVPGPGKPPRRAIRDGLRQLSGTLRRVRQYRGLVRFLLARMLSVDGLATLFAMGGVFAAGTFDMTEAEVLGFGVALSASAGLGAAVLARVDDWIGGKHTAALALVGLLAAGSVALAAPDRSVFWAASLVLGLFVGPAQAATRSWFARMAPAELRTEMFGFYALAGKATAFLGPLLVGAVAAATGSQRLAMGVILVFFAGGLLLLLGVPRDAPRASAPAAGST